MRGKDASQTRRTPQNEVRDNTAGGNLDTVDWKEIKAALTNIKEGLEKEEVGMRFVGELSKVIERVSHASRKPPATGMEARLERIEKMLSGRAIAPRQGVQGSSWAAMAAVGMRQAGAPQPPVQARHTVRVQMAQAKGKSNEEILKEIRKTITGAAAIRVLHSGDIDVTVPDETAKDRAYGLPSTDELRIFKKDYLVEVPGVPLSVRVAGEKGADNSQLAAAICAVSKTMTPGLQITRIRWLHSPDRAVKQRGVSEKPAKTRGSLIIGFPSQEMQRRALRGGLVIEAQLFETRPFEQALMATQCFKCQQWGHTQTACTKPARCGQCAGGHATRVCPEQRVSCVNCGKNHRSWQRRECTSFQAYFQGVQSRRFALYAQASTIGESGRTTPQSDLQASEWTMISRKRTRGPSPSQDDSQRRLGRPTYLEQAARDPSQSRIRFGHEFAGASQGSHMGNPVPEESEIPLDE